LSGISVRYFGSECRAVAQMSCTSSASNLTFNVSYFDLGVTQTVRYWLRDLRREQAKLLSNLSLLIHRSRRFQSLFAAAATGIFFENCTLTTKNSTSETIEFLLKPVAVTKVDAIAQSATAEAAGTAYTQVTFEYDSVLVTSPGSEADDGGASPANDGWVRVKNRPLN
jgi:hypothetical protein